MKRSLVFVNRSFRTAYRSHLQGSRRER